MAKGGCSEAECVPESVRRFESMDRYSHVGHAPP